MKQNYLFKEHAIFGLPHRDQTFYESFPPDNLHTLYAGLLRYSVCWALDIVKACKGNKALFQLDEVFLTRFRLGSSLDGEFKFVVPKHV